MDKDAALSAVISFSDAIRNAYQPVKVVLYGSYARGEQQDSSDIDVAVIVDEITGDFMDAEAGLYRIRRRIDDRIEPVLLEMGEDRSGFLDTVLRTGEVVYERAEWEPDRSAQGGQRKPCSCRSGRAASGSEPVRGRE